MSDDELRDDECWARQLGPAYTAVQVAQLLGVSKQAVAKRRGLLRLEQRDGQTVYPVVQFDGDRILPGLETVVLTLTGHVASAWTIASWLSSPQPSLDGHRPLDILRRGDVPTAVRAAQGFAAALAQGQLPSDRDTDERPSEEVLGQLLELGFEPDELAQAVDVQLAQLHRLASALTDSLIPPGPGQWFRARNRMLAGRRPLDVLLAEGDYDEVKRAVDGYIYGVHL